MLFTGQVKLKIAASGPHRGSEDECQEGRGKKRSLSWVLYTAGENMSQEHPTKKARAGDNPAADCTSGGSDPLCYVAICTPMLSAAAPPFTQPRNKTKSATQ